MTTLFSDSVRLRFGRAARSYHAGAGVQEVIAQATANRILLPQIPLRILDLGCGTGFLARAMAKRYPLAHIDALDIAEGMIEEAKLQTPGDMPVHYMAGNVFSHDTSSPYDVLISSSALQWMQPLAGLFHHLRTLLCPEGKFYFSVLVDGTLGELHQLRRQVSPSKPGTVLPAPDELRNAAISAGFSPSNGISESFIQEYPSATEFFRYIHDLGFTGRLPGHSSPPLTRRELSALIELYSQKQASPGGVSATFASYYFEGML